MPNPRTHRGVVFLTEDDDSLRETTKELLEDEGYLVLTARDGEEALARMRGIAMPAVAIVDLIMPGMDGWNLIRRMRADRELAHIPIVVLSGADRKPVVGADKVLRKPYVPDVLLGYVKELCGRPSPA